MRRELRRREYEGAMATNISVKTRIRVNGREYASVEEMPADIRQTYERALAMSAGGAHGGLLGSVAGRVTAVSTKIVFNGQEYTSAEHMPAAVRRLYEDVIATLQADERNSGDLNTSGPPASAGVAPIGAVAVSSASSGLVRPESTTMRLVIAGAVAAALLLASFVLRH